MPLHHYTVTNTKTGKLEGRVEQLHLPTEEQTEQGSVLRFMVPAEIETLKNLLVKLGAKTLDLGDQYTLELDEDAPGFLHGLFAGICQGLVLRSEKMPTGVAFEYSIMNRTVTLGKAATRH